LVLSGGAARGFAHVGVWRALREAGVHIDAVGGTSMGSVVAASLALGYDPQSFVDVCKGLFDKYRPFKEYTLPVFSILRSRRLDQMLRLQWGEIEIEDLWINYFCVSANLTAAEAKIHTRGSLFKAVRSSIAIPGITLPVIDGDDLFVDGGLVNSMPGDVMKEICRGRIITVDTTPSRDVEIDKGCTEFPSPWSALLSRFNPFHKPKKMPNILQIMARATMINSIQRRNDVREEVDYYLRPPVERFGMLEFESIDAIVETGYRYAREKINEFGGITAD
jgi:predicted acylesterase/phospholipase RssA